MHRNSLTNADLYSKRLIYILVNTGFNSRYLLTRCSWVFALFDQHLYTLNHDYYAYKKKTSERTRLDSAFVRRLRIILNVFRSCTPVYINFCLLFCDFLMSLTLCLPPFSLNVYFTLTCFIYIILFKLYEVQKMTFLYFTSFECPIVISFMVLVHMPLKYEEGSDVSGGGYGTFPLSQTNGCFLLHFFSC